MVDLGVGVGSLGVYPSQNDSMKTERKRAMKGWLILGLVVACYFGGPYATYGMAGYHIKWWLPPISPIWPLPWPVPIPLPS